MGQGTSSKRRRDPDSNEQALTGGSEGSAGVTNATAPADEETSSSTAKSDGTPRLPEVAVESSVKDSATRSASAVVSAGEISSPSEQDVETKEGVAVVLKSKIHLKGP